MEMGATKNGELQRTIEIISDIIEENKDNTEKALMMSLYMLKDTGRDNKSDINQIIEIIKKRIEEKNKIKERNQKNRRKKELKKIFNKEIKELSKKGIDKWLEKYMYSDNNEFTIYFAETGMDREMDFNQEVWFDEFIDLFYEPIKKQNTIKI